MYPSRQSPLFKSNVNLTHTRTHTTETGCPLDSVTGPNYSHGCYQRPLYTRSDWLGWTSSDHLIGYERPGFGWKCDWGLEEGVLYLQQEAH